MDIKNLKPKDILPLIDGLLEKIPDPIASILKKFAATVLGIFVLYAAYVGWSAGYSSIKEEGQELAKDTKTMFLEDIERSYNRKRSDIRMGGGDISEALSTESFQPEKEYLSSRRDSSLNPGLVPPDSKLMERQGMLQESRSQRNSPPLEVVDGGELEKSEENSGSRIQRKTYRPSKDSFLLDNPSISDDSYYEKQMRETSNKNHSGIEEEPTKTNQKRLNFNPEDSMIFQNNTEKKKTKLQIPKSKKRNHSPLE
ncbi:MAG: hypothetical protein H7A24_02090 [Leptospiraceae bacterium]|nr:hypothetical protein [Leptospiraceae bacterium]MCP5510640.1 hypothetical protein [Leptospiraceae bacterium]